LIGQNFGSQKVFEVLVICNNVNRKSRLFQIVLPDLECFKNSKEFLIMSTVVELSCQEYSMKYIYNTSQMSKLSLILCTFSITGSVAGLFLILVELKVWE